MTREQLKQELILNIVAELKKRFPGEDKTSKQDRSDMSKECFGVSAYAELKDLPVATLQRGYVRLTQPKRAVAPPPIEDDVPTHATPTSAPQGVDTQTGEVLGQPDTDDGTEPMDDETATEAVCLQLERYAESQGMVPAWQALLQDYDQFRMEDGVLVLTLEERQQLVGQARAVWPDLTERDVSVF